MFPRFFSICNAILAYAIFAERGSSVTYCVIRSWRIFKPVFELKITRAVQTVNCNIGWFSYDIVIIICITMILTMKGYFRDSDYFNEK